MEKSCANHPESIALAACKACDKSICLMCVVDEKEGSFCSAFCYEAFQRGEEVAKFEPEPAAVTHAQALDSIFDTEPQSLPVPGSSDPEPIVAEGTKWRPLNVACTNHSDTPAVATCDRCSRAVCALCLLEAAQGTFCSTECLQAGDAPMAEQAALKGRPLTKPPPSPARNAAARSRSRNTAGKAVGWVAVVAVFAGVGYSGWFFSQNKRFPWDPPAEPHRAARHPQPPSDVKPKPPVNPGPTAEVRIDPKVQPRTDPKVGVKVDPKMEPPPETFAPAARVKVTPKPPPKPTRVLNAWADVDPGTWYRYRVEEAAGKGYVDSILKEKGPTYAVVQVVSSRGGESEAKRIDADTVVLGGEEKFTFDERAFPCEIRMRGEAEGAPRTWALLSAKYPGAVLKSTGPEGALTAQRVWDHVVRVGRRGFDCLVVEGTIEKDGAKTALKTWYSGAVPGGIVREEAPGRSRVLVDWGLDGSKRPPFPP